MKKETFLKVVRESMKTEPTQDEISFLGSMGSAIEQAFQADTVERGKEIETQMSKLVGSFEEGETAAAVIRSLAKKVDDMEKKSKRNLNADEKYRLKSMLIDKKDEILRARTGGNPWSIEFKASRAPSEKMTTATILTGATAHNNVNIFDDMEIAIFRYPKNFIIDVVGGMSVSNVPETWKWKEEIVAGDGVPGVTPEGTAKPLVDKKFTWKFATRKKYAGRIEMTEEVEIDFEQLVMDITAMFERDVITAWNDGVLAEIVAWTPPYASSSLDGQIVNPTVYSCIGALQLQVASENYDADFVFINPGDAAESIYLQDSGGSQQFIPIELQFGGLTPYISNKVAAGTLVVGTSQLVREQHSNFILRKGVYGTQFIDNESTIVGEVFSVLKLPTEYKKGWVQGDIVTVKAALQKV